MAKASAAPGESATPGYYLDSELTFARGYAYMASHFTSVRVSGSRLRPKLHYFMHMMIELQKEVDAGLPCVLNTGLWLCESNEDFIARVPGLAAECILRRPQSGVCSGI